MAMAEPPPVLPPEELSHVTAQLTVKGSTPWDVSLEKTVTNLLSECNEGDLFSKAVSKHKRVGQVLKIQLTCTQRRPATNDDRDAIISCVADAIQTDIKAASRENINDGTRAGGGRIAHFGPLQATFGKVVSSRSRNMRDCDSKVYLVMLLTTLSAQVIERMEHDFGRKGATRGYKPSEVVFFSSDVVQTEQVFLYTAPSRQAHNHVSQEARNRPVSAKRILDGVCDVHREYAPLTQRLRAASWFPENWNISDDAVLTVQPEQRDGNGVYVREHGVISEELAAAQLSVRGAHARHNAELRQLREATANHAALLAQIDEQIAHEATHANARDRTRDKRARTVRAEHQASVDFAEQAVAVATAAEAAAGADVVAKTCAVTLLQAERSAAARHRMLHGPNVAVASRELGIALCVIEYFTRAVEGYPRVDRDPLNLGPELQRLLVAGLGEDHLHQLWMEQGTAAASGVAAPPPLAWLRSWVFHQALELAYSSLSTLVLFQHRGVGGAVTAALRRGPPPGCAADNTRRADTKAAPAIAWNQLRSAAAVTRGERAAELSNEEAARIFNAQVKATFYNGQAAQKMWVSGPPGQPARLVSVPLDRALLAGIVSSHMLPRARQLRAMDLCGPVERERLASDELNSPAVHRLRRVEIGGTDPYVECSCGFDMGNINTRRTGETQPRSNANSNLLQILQQRRSSSYALKNTPGFFAARVVPTRLEVEESAPPPIMLNSWPGAGPADPYGARLGHQIGISTHHLLTLALQMSANYDMKFGLAADDTYGLTRTLPCAPDGLNPEEKEFYVRIISIILPGGYTVPVAVFLASRKHTESYTHTLFAFKDLAERTYEAATGNHVVLKPVLFMQDGDLAARAAVRTVFGYDSSMCVWHLVKDVGKNCDRLQVPKLTQAAIVRMVHVLLKAESWVLFSALLAVFLTFMTEAMELVDFSRYFSAEWYNKRRDWGACFQRSARFLAFSTSNSPEEGINAKLKGVAGTGRQLAVALHGIFTYLATDCTDRSQVPTLEGKASDFGPPLEPNQTIPGCLDVAIKMHNAHERMFIVDVSARVRAGVLAAAYALEDAAVYKAVLDDRADDSVGALLAVGHEEFSRYITMVAPFTDRAAALARANSMLATPVVDLVMWEETYCHDIYVFLAYLLHRDSDPTFKLPLDAERPLGFLDPPYDLPALGAVEFSLVPHRAQINAWRSNSDSISAAHTQSATRAYQFVDLLFRPARFLNVADPRLPPGVRGFYEQPPDAQLPLAQFSVDGGLSTFDDSEDGANMVDYTTCVAGLREAFHFTCTTSLPSYSGWACCCRAYGHYRLCPAVLLKGSGTARPTFAEQRL